MARLGTGYWDRRCSLASSSASPVPSGFVGYTIYAEYFGRTIGKKLMGIRVVRESGTRISLGQGLLRQLPFFAQFFFIDALFVLFTEKGQRAFELITKTRAVVAMLGLVLLT